MKILQKYRFFDIKILSKYCYFDNQNNKEISLIWSPKYRWFHIKILIEYRCFDIKRSPRYFWFDHQNITKIFLIWSSKYHQDISDLIIKISLEIIPIWLSKYRCFSIKILPKYLLSSYQNIIQISLLDIKISPKYLWFIIMIALNSRARMRGGAWVFRRRTVRR